MTPNVQKADLATTEKCTNNIRQTIAVINL